MAAALLGHGGEPEVDVTKYPGGVQDAFAVLSEGSKPEKRQKAIRYLSAATTKEQEHLPMGQGQLGKATQIATLSGCLQRVGDIDKTLAQRKVADGNTLKKAVSAAKTSVDSNLRSAVWLKIFDERLREIRSYHARHNTRVYKRARLGNPSADGYDLASSVTQTIQPVQDGTLFNSEEIMGKYLDLKLVYENSVFPIKHVFNKQDTSNNNDDSFGFADFLMLLSNGINTNIPEEKKLKERKKYIRFLTTLQTYLEGFLKRTQPLLKFKDVTDPGITELENDWRQTGGCEGWEAKPAEKSMVDDSSSTAALDLAPYASAADLVKAIDGDTLKAELSRLGLKCGGTVADRAKRLFATKGTPLDKLPKKYFAKTANGPTAAKNEKRVDVAKREALVMALLNQLKPTLEATLRRSERRETQTLKEREKEMEEDLHGSTVEGPKEKAEGEEDSDSDDEDAPIYNPKGVPLGWDGKPMPYWLFKLHGLNHFYPCEICGNEQYRGRRNFETHFTEAKHAYGMKSLGIPNTKHFHGVTKIEDAQNLWKKLKGQLQQQQFDGSKDEEYEDSNGNVLSRSTYEDLARQGLL
jgi:splicing factor 3A subunit 3